MGGDKFWENVDVTTVSQSYVLHAFNVNDVYRCSTLMVGSAIKRCKPEHPTITHAVKSAIIAPTV